MIPSDERGGIARDMATALFGEQGVKAAERRALSNERHERVRDWAASIAAVVMALSLAGAAVIGVVALARVLL